MGKFHQAISTYLFLFLYNHKFQVQAEWWGLSASCLPQNVELLSISYTKLCCQNLDKIPKSTGKISSVLGNVLQWLITYTCCG